MDLRPSDASERVRAAARLFLAENLPAGWAGLGALDSAERAAFIPGWRELLRVNGYLGTAWPVEYGGAGMDQLEQSVVQEEFTRAGVPLLPLPTDAYGFILIGPTILHCGTEEQKEHFIPRILSGEYRFAQGFSEPGAGSDLFALRTKARLDGDVWVINGQKTWQTQANAANWMFVLVRTAPDEPNSRALSMLLVPLEQPGVLVRPIRAMTGNAEFCEVFFDDARTAAGNIVGAPGAGVSTALTLLGFERGSATGSMHSEYRVELDRLVRLARERGMEHDPSVRQRIAWCHTRVEAIKHLSWRALTRAQTGEVPGAESSQLKLLETTYHVKLTELAMDILGPAGMVRTGQPAVASLGPDVFGAPNTPAAWQHVYMTARAATIYGGSSQIQRTTLGERVLGLPPEPRVRVRPAQETTQ